MNAKSASKPPCTSFDIYYELKWSRSFSFGSTLEARYLKILNSQMFIQNHTIYQPKN